MAIASKLGSFQPSWTIRPNPEDQINRKPDGQKMTEGPKIQKTEDQKEFLEVGPLDWIRKTE